MSMLTITAKGQVTLRKELLKHLGVGPGDQLIVEPRLDGRVEIRAARSAGKISDVFGLLKDDNGPRLSVEEIGDIAARSWAGDR